jgi:MoaA/NifB/PqqE/SkfB family radical SAM enzyme
LRPQGPGEHDATAVAAALAALQKAAGATKTAPAIGLETVLTAANAAELPALVEWAAARGVQFILASHLLLYESGSEDLDLFNPHPPAANRLYLRHAREAAAAGIDLQRALVNRLQLKKGEENRANRIFSAMQEEAAALDLRLHLPSLIRRHSQENKDIETWLHKAKHLARKPDIDLRLPPLEAQWPPSCPFIEERAALIDVAGQVMPCHSLWHGHRCFMHGELLQIRPRSFGRLDQASLTTIWQKEEYRHFRHEAGEYRHAPCWNCSQGPCPTLINDDLGYANDCYGSSVPCGHCRWSLGAVRCL